MNDYAGLPWYLRHGFFAGLMALAGVGIHSWIAIVAIFVGCFAVTLLMQALIDGFHPSKW
jgi:hypothetical protein